MNQWFLFQQFMTGLNIVPQLIILHVSCISSDWIWQPKKKKKKKNMNTRKHCANLWLKMKGHEQTLKTGSVAIKISSKSQN